jgi:hypothetical protein
MDVKLPEPCCTDRWWGWQPDVLIAATSTRGKLQANYNNNGPGRVSRYSFKQQQQALKYPEFSVVVTLKSLLAMKT